MTAPPTWLEPVSSLLEANAGRGGYLLAFPEYRPDLATALAHWTGLPFFDYREQELRPRGIEAGRVTLEQLAERLAALAAGGGAVVFNVEALLATKDLVDRTRWLLEFVNTDWPHPLIVPITVFADELPADIRRCHRFDESQLPPLTLVGRLAH